MEAAYGWWRCIRNGGITKNKALETVLKNSAINGVKV